MARVVDQLLDVVEQDEHFAPRRERTTDLRPELHRRGRGADRRVERGRQRGAEAFRAMGLREVDDEGRGTALVGAPDADWRTFNTISACCIFSLWSCTSASSLNAMSWCDCSNAF